MRVGCGGARERAGVAHERVERRRREVRGRDDGGRVADEDAQPRAPLASALELLGLAQAHRDRQPLALTHEHVRGTCAGGARPRHEVAGEVAEVHPDS